MGDFDITLSTELHINISDKNKLMLFKTTSDIDCCQRSAFKERGVAKVRLKSCQTLYASLYILIIEIT